MWIRARPGGGGFPAEILHEFRTPFMRATYPVYIIFSDFIWHGVKCMNFPIKQHSLAPY
jgi:hypothetical protein